MNYCCENGRSLMNSCKCSVNNKALVLSTVIALVLLNCLDEKCIETLSAFLVSTGDLLITGLTDNCSCR